MTCCVGLKFPGGAVLGCDSRVCAGNDIVTDTCEKFVIAGTAACLVSGHDGALLDAIAQARNADGVRLLASEYTSGSSLSWDLLVYDRRLERLLIVDSHGSAIEVGDSFATGSGGSYAQGVISASAKPTNLAQAQKLVRRAIDVAVKHNAACGGRIRLITVEGKRKKISVS